MESRLVKYMGSKHALLSNGLGDIILEQSQHARRIVDLFCGGSSVAWFAAENTELPVLAIDLQEYAVVLAGSVVCRTETLDYVAIADDWLNEVRRAREDSKYWRLAREMESACTEIDRYVEASRELCRLEDFGPIWSSYGGHYFSPSQALTIDTMLDAIPEHDPMHTLCMAATISSGSQCAAAPGHTAQPFQPTRGASRYIAEAWSKDPLTIARRALKLICSKKANTRGDAAVAEAVSLASTLSKDDLVVVDPPYSGVQYSRFYHVLETIARRKVESVVGRGRYPPLYSRPQSSFSKPSESKNALRQLLENLAKAQTTVIFTFPTGQCSNGLSGEIVSQMSSDFFAESEHRIISGQFSTLGGNNSNRLARSRSEELVLVMRG